MTFFSLPFTGLNKSEPHDDSSKVRKKGNSFHRNMASQNAEQYYQGLCSTTDNKNISTGKGFSGRTGWGRAGDHCESEKDALFCDIL